MQTETIALYGRDGHEQVFSLAEHARMVGNGQVGAGKDWSSVAPPPAGWDRVVPKYRVRRDLKPTAFARHQHEPPFDQAADVWQFADRIYKANEIVETKCWPHATMIPLNYGAEKVMEFFNGRMKSRLTTTPWHIDRLRLDDGMSGPLIPAIDVPPPQSSPKPVSAQPPRRESMRRVV
jgi:hypothetical protein